MEHLANVMEHLANQLPATIQYEGQTVYLHILKYHRKTDNRDSWDVRYRYSLALTMQPIIKSLQFQTYTLRGALYGMYEILKEKGYIDGEG